MAKAYACDRCGELFTRHEYSVTVPVVLESDKEYGIDFGDTQTYISLCPKCRAGFQKWWDEGAVHKTIDYLHRTCSLYYEVPEEVKNEGIHNQ